MSEPALVIINYNKNKCYLSFNEANLSPSSDGMGALDTLIPLLKLVMDERIIVEDVVFVSNLLIYLSHLKVDKNKSRSSWQDFSEYHQIDPAVKPDTMRWRGGIYELSLANYNNSPTVFHLQYWKDRPKTTPLLFASDLRIREDDIRKGSLRADEAEFDNNLNFYNALKSNDISFAHPSMIEKS
jgi:hypothetical protein